METYTVKFTCTCGEPAEEMFLENAASMTALITLVSEVVMAGIEDVYLFANSPDGEQRDITVEVLLGIALGAAGAL